MPRLSRLPRAGGLVELSGIVIEGRRGYRAERAELIGPLELDVPCAGTSASGDFCERDVEVVIDADHTPRGRCPWHSQPVDGADRLGLDDWLDSVVADLEAIYDTPVLTFEKGGGHGHR